MTCKVLARVHFDKKHGLTTSEATKDFLRRTCPCDVCRTWRVPPKMR